MSSFISDYTDLMAAVTVKKDLLTSLKPQITDQIISEYIDSKIARYNELINDYNRKIELAQYASMHNWSDENITVFLE